MQLRLTATLSIAYGNAPISATRNKQKVQAPLRARLEPHPHLLDRKQTQLSAEILLMQRHIRESKRRGLDARASRASRKSMQDNASNPHPTLKPKIATQANVRTARKDDWEELSLEEVQPGDLQAMDLTGLSTSLLAHPKGARVDYTEREHKMLMALLEKKEKKTARGRETRPSRDAVK